MATMIMSSGAGELPGLVSTGTQPPRIHLAHERVSGVDYSGLTLESFSSVGCDFVDCSFASVKASSVAFGAGTVRSTYTNCTFDGSRLEMLPGGFARFVDCSFRDVRISRWNTGRVDLVRCVFSGSMRNALIWAKSAFVIPGMESGDTVIDGNDFSGVEGAIDFRGGVDLDRQILPESDDIMLIRAAESAADRAEGRIVAWGDDDEAKRLGMGEVAIVRIFVSQGQRDVLLFRGTTPAHVWQRLREAFEAE